LLEKLKLWKITMNKAKAQLIAALADFRNLRARRAEPRHRPYSPERYRQEGELNMLDHIIELLEGTSETKKDNNDQS
jgi:hypothetical protein